MNGVVFVDKLTKSTLVKSQSSIFDLRTFIPRHMPRIIGRNSYMANTAS